MSPMCAFHAAGISRRPHGKPARMEERGGDAKDQVARIAGRGRDDAAPVVLQLGVTAVVAALVAVILIVSIVVWIVLR